MKRTDFSISGALSPEGMGGPRARKGFDFQDNWLCTSVAEWLNLDSFDSFMHEGADDIDVFRKLDSRTTNVHRYQIKDHKLSRAQFCELLGSFNRAHSAHQGDWSQFEIVSPACANSLLTFNQVIERVRGICISGYDKNSSYYTTTFREFEGYLRKLKINAEPDFVLRYIWTDFFAGWAQNDNRVLTLTRGLLQALGILHEHSEEAAERLFVAVRKNRGRRVYKDDLLNTLGTFFPFKSLDNEQKSNVADIRVEFSPVQTVTFGGTAKPLSCSIDIFPEGSTLIRSSPELVGLIDCGPSCAAPVLRHLMMHQARELTFVAISHWHFDHWGGLTSILSTFDRIRAVFLPPDDPPNNRASRVLMARLSYLARTTATRISKLSNAAHYTIFNEGYRDPSGIKVNAFVPRKHYDSVSRYNPNDICAVFQVTVGNQSFLVPGDASLRAWDSILSIAATSGIDLISAGMILPHSGSEGSMSRELFSRLLKSDKSVAVLNSNLNHRFRLPSRDVLSLVAEHGAHLSVCERRLVSLTLTSDGVMMQSGAALQSDE